MSQQLKAANFTDRSIEGFGPVRIRHIKAREMFQLGEEKDNAQSVQKMVALCVYQGEAPLFASAADVADADWLLVKQMSDAAMEVNKLKDAEKK
jgi:hypothetical protein